MAYIKERKMGRRAKERGGETFPKIFIQSTSGRVGVEQQNDTILYLLERTGFGTFSRFSDTICNL